MEWVDLRVFGLRSLVEWRLFLWWICRLVMGMRNFNIDNVDLSVGCVELVSFQ